MGWILFFNGLCCYQYCLFLHWTKFGHHLVSCLKGHNLFFHENSKFRVFFLLILSAKTYLLRD